VDLQKVVLTSVSAEADLSALGSALELTRLAPEGPAASVALVDLAPAVLALVAVWVVMPSTTPAT